MQEPKPVPAFAASVPVPGFRRPWRAVAWIVALLGLALVLPSCDISNPQTAYYLRMEGADTLVAYDSLKVEVSDHHGHDEVVFYGKPDRVALLDEIPVHFPLSDTFEVEVRGVKGGLTRLHYRSTQVGNQVVEKTHLPVERANQPPQFQIPAQATVAENDSLILAIATLDPDGDSVRVRVDSLPVWATFRDGSLGLRPGFGQAGAYQLYFHATDGKATTDQALKVVVTHTNRRPILQSIANFKVAEGDSVDLAIHATDPDGDSVWLSIDSLPPGAVLRNGRLQWRTHAGQARNYSLVVVADDGKGGKASTSFVLTVGNVNRPPQITPVPPKTVRENDSLGFTVSATDPDGDAVTLSPVSALPTGAHFDPKTGAFAWRPGFNQAGSYSVTFQAQDGKDTSKVIVDITVEDVDRPPTLSVSNQSIRAGDTLAFSVTASDPDTDSVIVQILSIDVPAGYTWSGRRFTWVPPLTQAGTYHVTFKADDGKGGQAQQAITITVSPNKRGPRLLQPVPVVDSVELGRAYQYQIKAVDDNGEGVSYSLVDAPAGAQLTVGGLLLWSADRAKYAVGQAVVVHARVRNGVDSLELQWAVKVISHRWVKVNSTLNLDTSGGVDVFHAIVALDSQHLFMAGGTNFLTRSSDGGKSWNNSCPSTKKVEFVTGSQGRIAYLDDDRYGIHIKDPNNCSAILDTNSRTLYYGYPVQIENLFLDGDGNPYMYDGNCLFSGKKRLFCADDAGLVINGIIILPNKKRFLVSFASGFEWVDFDTPGLSVPNPPYFSASSMAFGGDTVFVINNSDSAYAIWRLSPIGDTTSSITGSRANPSPATIPFNPVNMDVVNGFVGWAINRDGRVFFTNNGFENITEERLESSDQGVRIIVSFDKQAIFLLAKATKGGYCLYRY